MSAHLTYYMRTGWAVLLAATAVAAATAANADPVILAPVQVSAPSCVDVQIEGARSLSFDCLNQTLKDAAQQQTDTAPTATAKDAAGNGAPTTTGTFSFTATSIRMGNAFGHSATPQRPPAPSFTSALAPQHGAR